MLSISDFLFFQFLFLAGRVVGKKMGGIGGEGGRAEEGGKQNDINFLWVISSQLESCKQNLHGLKFPAQSSPFPSAHTFLTTEPATISQEV